MGGLKIAQDLALGIRVHNSLESPGLASWGTFSRPFGTEPGSLRHPALRAGLFSAVPAGLNSEVSGFTQTLKPS
jgi:hypothetical protein